MTNVKKVEINKQKPLAGIWFLIIGIIMICLGVNVWFNPAASLMALALYIGVVFVISGIIYLYAAIKHSSGWFLAFGLLDLFVGIIFLTNLGVTVASLPIIFALWTLFIGVIQVAESFYRKSMSHPWIWEMMSGFIGIIFAFIIISNPIIGAITITMLMGLYIMLYGLMCFVEYATIKKYI